MPLDRRGFLEQAGAVALGGSLARRRRAYGGDLGPLRRALRGNLLTRSDSGYGAARVVYDMRFDSIRPLAVAYCESADDVARTIDFARRNRIPLAPRSGGHSYGGYSTVRDGIVVDVSRMAGIVVSADGKQAAVGAGAKLIDVYSTLWKRGVTIPAGSCATVGIAGLALGGGVGFASRKLGTTTDSLVSVALVKADGKPVVADARREPDLFWASRGGGGNFGVATSFRFRVHPVSTVSRFFVQWPWAQAKAAVQAWQSFAPHAPDELFSVMNLSGAPSVVAVGQYFGSDTDLRALIRPLTSTGTPTSVSVLSSSFYQAVLHWAGSRARATFKGKSDYVNTPLVPEAIDTMIEWIGRRAGMSGSGSILLDSYGGAINRVPQIATAFVHRNALYSCQYLAYWEGGGAGANLAWIDGFYDAMRPYVSGFAYQNYIDPDLEHWQNAYYGRNLQRLMAVKKKVDPENVFRFAQSIPVQ